MTELTQHSQVRVLGKTVSLQTYEKLLGENLLIAQWLAGQQYLDRATAVASCGRWIAEADGEWEVLSHCRKPKSCLICGTLKHMRETEPYTELLKAEKRRSFERSRSGGGPTLDLRSFLNYQLLVTSAVSEDEETAVRQTEAMGILVGNLKRAFQGLDRDTDQFVPVMFGVIHPKAERRSNGTVCYQPHAHVSIAARRGPLFKSVRSDLVSFCERTASELSIETGIPFTLARPLHLRYSSVEFIFNTSRFCRYLASRVFGVSRFLDYSMKIESGITEQELAALSNWNWEDLSPARTVIAFHQTRKCRLIWRTSHRMPTQRLPKPTKGLPNRPPCPPAIMQTSVALLPRYAGNDNDVPNLLRYTDSDDMVLRLNAFCRQFLSR